MKRRTLVMAAPLAVLAPCEIAEAMNSTFASVAHESLARGEREQGGAMGGSTVVCCFNGIGHVDLKVGGEVYLGAVSHVFRGRSMLNPCHAGQRYMRFEGTDREWTMMGDSHVPGMLKYTDGDKTRVAINAGSLQINSGFGKRFFSLTTHPVDPLIVFHPDKHMMTPFWSVKEWLSVSGSGPNRNGEQARRPGMGGCPGPQCTKI